VGERRDKKTSEEIRENDGEQREEGEEKRSRIE